MEREAPHCCGVCGQVLHRAWNSKGEPGWLHALELTGKTDHPTVPVPYDEGNLISQCDFCGIEVPLDERWYLPAEDFTTLVIDGGPKAQSRGGWGTCSGCVEHVRNRDWQTIIERHMATMGHHYEADLAEFFSKEYLPAMFRALEEHITEEVRPWRAGDEKALP